MLTLKRPIIAATLVAISVTAGAAAPAQADPKMTPDYEVKLLLNPAVVLGSDHKLTSTVRSAFGMPSTVTKMNVQFLDTNSKTIYANGWSPRIRKTEGESDFELTYKKRYAITGGNIDGALTTANAEGFDAGDTGYEAQVEWGYQQLTLSISRPKTASDAGYSGIEVWPILNAAGTGTEDIVEASFKTTSRTTASSKHDSLVAYLQSKGWFVAQDSLKTQLIMDRY